MHKYKKIVQQGFALPTLIIAGTILMIVGVSTLVASTSITKTLQDQHWNRLADEAAQAGVAYAKSCLDKNNTQFWSGSLRPNSNNCSGGSNSYIAQEPGEWTATFSVPAPGGGSSSEPYKTEVTGTVNLIAAGKTYTSKDTVILNVQDYECSNVDTCNGETLHAVRSLVDLVYWYGWLYGKYPGTGATPGSGDNNISTCVGQDYPSNRCGWINSGTNGSSQSTPNWAEHYFTSNATWYSKMSNIQFGSTTLAPPPMPSTQQAINTAGRPYVGIIYFSQTPSGTTTQGKGAQIYYFLKTKPSQTGANPNDPNWNNACGNQRPEVSVTGFYSLVPNMQGITVCIVSLPNLPGAIPAKPTVNSSISSVTLSPSATSFSISGLTASGGVSPYTWSYSLQGAGSGIGSHKPCQNLNITSFPTSGSGPFTVSGQRYAPPWYGTCNLIINATGSNGGVGTRVIPITQQ